MSQNHSDWVFVGVTASGLFLYEHKITKELLNNKEYWRRYNETKD